MIDVAKAGGSSVEPLAVWVSVYTSTKLVPTGGADGQLARVPVGAGQPARPPEPQTSCTPAVPPVRLEALPSACWPATPGAHAPSAQLLATASAAASAPFCSSARS